MAQQLLSVEDLRRPELGRDVPPTLPPDELTVLDEIQRRALWLSALMVHYANNVRPNTDGV
jgi:hypothetical protein